MDIVSEQRDALIVTGMLAVGFALLVATTASHEYGILLMKSDRLTWSVTRIIPVLGWLSLAGLLVIVRSAVVWASAAAAAAVTFLAALAFILVTTPPDVQAQAILASLSYYALISGMLCLTIRNAVVAAFAGPALLILQVFADVAAHLLTGVIRFGC